MPANVPYGYYRVVKSQPPRLSLLAGRNVEVQVESGLLSVKKRWDFQTNSTSPAILAASGGQCGQFNRDSALNPSSRIRPSDAPI
jgi:hypothetical protein